MNESLRQAERLLEQVVGGRIHKLYRIVFEFNGNVDDWMRGQLELVTSSDIFLRFFDSNGGQILNVETERWTDDSPDDEEYIARFGKWRRKDVSNRAPYDELIGTSIHEVVAYRRNSNLGGLEFKTDEGEIFSVFAAADECFVRFSSLSHKLDTLLLDSVSFKLSVDEDQA